MPEDLPEVMEAVQSILEVRARSDPGTDLRSLDVVTRLRSGVPPAEIPAEDLHRLESTLWRLLPPPESRPGESRAAGGSLYDAYRRRLGLTP